MFHKVINYINERGKYTLILASFISLIVPHASLAESASRGLIVYSNGTMTNQFWPHYEETFETKAEPIRTMKVVATAYNSEPGQTDDSPFITAFGTRVRDGIIATNDFKRGTRVRLPELYGDKVFVVEDRMNRRYTGKSRIDLWMERKSDAIKFGARYLTMEVLPDEEVLADNN